MPIPNPPTSPEDGRRLARQRVWARKQRTRGIRRRVAAITLSLFVALWVAIFVHLVTGHDPALGASTRPTKTATSQTSTSATQAAAKQAAAAKSKASAAAASAATSTQAGSSSTGAGGSATDSSSTDSGSGSSSSAAPVTTSQS